MRIETPDASAADALADCWVTLAAEQRAYDSHLRAEANRSEMRDRIAQSIVMGELLVAREGDGRGTDEGEDGAEGEGADEDGDGPADDILGFVMFALDTGSLATRRRRGTVHNIYVVPDRRGEGIGSDLLAAAEAELAARGAEVVALEAMADNDAARRFYRRHGYDAHRVTLEKPMENDNHSRENV